MKKREADLRSDWGEVPQKRTEEKVEVVSYLAKGKEWDSAILFEDY
jgi:hypothetical protein